MIRQMRTINTALLKTLVWQRGEQCRTLTALGCEISVSMLEKLMAGTYGRLPKDETRKRMCAYLKVSENTLFPLVAANGKAMAS